MKLTEVVETFKRISLIKKEKKKKKEFFFYIGLPSFHRAIRR